MWNPNEPFDYPMYIAVPLSLEAEKTGDLFKHPELFHRVSIHWTIAKVIAESPFSQEAFKTMEAFIDLGEDPHFGPREVGKLLEAFEAWWKKRTPGDEGAFEVTESLLKEAKERGRGIIFKF
jgi:hypothetical protein